MRPPDGASSSVPSPVVALSLLPVSLGDLPSSRKLLSIAVVAAAAAAAAAAVAGEKAFAFSRACRRVVGLATLVILARFGSSGGIYRIKKCRVR